MGVRAGLVTPKLLAVPVDLVNTIAQLPDGAALPISAWFSAVQPAWLELPLVRPHGLAGHAGPHGAARPG